MERYWPRVIRIEHNKENKVEDKEKYENKIKEFIFSVKDKGKRKMLESVFLNNIFYAKGKNQLELLFKIIISMNVIDRKFFVLQEYKDLAYVDSALPIKHNQTISQPTTVARMLLLLFDDLANKKKKITVYEIGTGSGWNAAIMAYLLKLYKKEYEVKSVDRIKELIEFAKRNISKIKKEKKIRLKLDLKCEDGFEYIKRKKFDYIIFTAGIPNKKAENKIKEMAKSNLNVNGKIVVPETYGGIFIFKKEKNRKEVSIKKTEETYAFVPLLRGKIL